MTLPSKATYLVDRSNGDRLRINGCIPSVEPPPQAQNYATARFQCQELPPRVDLRPFLSPVENQGQVGSCTANALAGAYEYLIRRHSGDQGDVSRLFLYFNARWYDNIQGDYGSSITTSIRVLQELGICREHFWVYDPSLVNAQPSGEAYEDAQYFQVLQAAQVDINLYAIKHCLAEGYPITFGLKLFESFNQATQSGIVPMPDPTEAGRREHGSHAMLCVGYSDEAQVFIVRNSWGEDWGDQGYCYIPYDYLTNPQVSFDFWTIYTLEDNDLTPGVWRPDSSPLFGASNVNTTYDYDYEFEECDELNDVGSLTEIKRIPVKL